MKVSDAGNTYSSWLNSATSGSKNQGSFAASLAAAQESTVMSSDSTTRSGLASHKTKPLTEDQIALQKLTEYMRKSPEEHIREKIMKAMGVTEEDLAAMPPEKREATEKAIAEKVKEYLLKQNGVDANAAQSASVDIQSLLG